MSQLANVLNITKAPQPSCQAQRLTASKSLSARQQQELRAILEQGLPQVAQPYLAIAEQINASPDQVLAQIALWQEQGLIKRFGLVVKHRQLGFKANAMVVWDIADEQVDAVAKLLSSCPEVSLCYRRPRRLPDWRYNLFCMIHGTDRAIVEAQIAAIVDKFALQAVNKDILFSVKAYKQQGARYTKKGNCHG
ncbi:transcriptional regulator, AsnC family [Colwellia chukchiensis]|uniref:Siroheme decarboxylase NirL subunit n=1 Tax=Colwellia chukchiensis TaxID=641665 RepID=A0A1H7M1A9_9GAMM|nr:Lrp/AsnC family transcriptional regulator [Colwellia chukchiensis]SEL04974.1 transcriptional regulator, AsnC family [Colwellia chukchiensis]